MSFFSQGGNLILYIKKHIKSVGYLFHGVICFYHGSLMCINTTINLLHFVPPIQLEAKVYTDHHRDQPTEPSPTCPINPDQSPITPNHFRSFPIMLRPGMLRRRSKRSIPIYSRVPRTISDHFRSFPIDPIMFRP